LKKKKKTIRKLLFYIPLFTAIYVFIAIIVGMFNIKEDKPLSFIYPIILENIYADIRNTYPSTIHNDLVQISKERVKCYGARPTNRLIGICDKDYLISLLTIGHKKIDSAPNIGTFLTSVANCPTIYSICRGYDGKEEECQSTEALCMDYIYDYYWRGIPFSVELSQKIL
jgi:hypothetical protein